MKEEKQELIDAFLELAVLGSLLYKVDEHGNKTHIKRFSRDSNSDVKTVTVINGKIQIDEK